MTVKWLYCEGKTDPPVLNTAFAALGVSNIVVESTGTSPAKVAAWKREQGVVAASVADRDYRPIEECNATYKPSGKKFYWRRHSIENYLLEPSVIARSFELFKASMAELEHCPDWVERLPSDVGDIETDMKAAAATIANQECGCIVHHQLWARLGDEIGHLQLALPEIFKSPDMQSDEECSRTLVESAEELRSAAEQWSKASNLSDANVRSMYETKCSQINSGDYQDGNRFLKEFHGKRLRRSFLLHLQATYGTNMSSASLQEELIKGLSSLLEDAPDSSVANDFRELSEIVDQLA